MFQYHTCKLPDFTDEFLQASPNAVAKVVLAHRIAQRTANDPSARLQAKVQWFQELIRQGFKRGQIKKLFRALEAMNPLPEELDVEFKERRRQCDPRKTMPIITSLERLACKEALAEGRSEGLSQGLYKGQLLTLRDAIRDLLEERFGHTQPDIGERMEQEMDPVVLKAWPRKTAAIESLEAFRKLLELRA